MAKNERRLKAKASRNQNAAKQAAVRRSHKSSNRYSLPWLRKHVHIAGLVVTVAFLAVLFAVARTSTDDENGDQANTHQIPQIDVVALEPDPECENKTRAFLDNFVCKYRPDNVEDTELDLGEGFCHPKLSASPHYRTQRVSSPQKDSLDRIWQKYIGAIGAAGGNGISGGELVMTLPRPLQIWDLDALRDRFTQQHFLGFPPDGASEAVPPDQRRSKDVVRHKNTQNPLDSGAFLAVYLIRLWRGSQAEVDESSSDISISERCRDNESGVCEFQQHWNDFGQLRDRIDLLASYLDILPAVRDRISVKSTYKAHSHPLFWSSSLLQNLFPRYTHTYDLIRHYQQMIESEYDALKLISDEFGKNVNYLDYLNMRINVLSRAFGLSVPQSDRGARWGSTDLDATALSLPEEIRLYETSNFGSFLDGQLNLDDESFGGFKVRAMCPLLDMYNSHPNPNVSWRYDSNSSSYLVHAKTKIPPGDSLVVSYGKYTDGHLFAKFGFVNGDGSSPSEVSLAVFHRMLGDVGLGRQYSHLPFYAWAPHALDNSPTTRLGEEKSADSKMKKTLMSTKQALKMQAKELLRYLIFDDGYEECIVLTVSSNSVEKELKLLKLQHLIHIANNRDAWIVRVPPKFPHAQPVQSFSMKGNVSASYDRRKRKDAVGVNANHIVSICRLLSLRADDIEGEAVDYLREGLDSLSSSNPFFFVEKHDDALEYRAMMCVVRLCNTALGRYLGYENSEPEVVGSREWNAWYVTTGEVRSLGIIQQTASNEAKRLKQRYEASKESISVAFDAMTVREEGSCPLNYSLPLLRSVSFD